MEGEAIESQLELQDRDRERIEKRTRSESVVRGKRKGERKKEDNLHTWECAYQLAGSTGILKCGERI